MKKYIAGTLIIAIGLLIFFAPFGYAQVCMPKADGSFMKCHWMGEASQNWSCIFQYWDWYLYNSTGNGCYRHVYAPEYALQRLYQAGHVTVSRSVDPHQCNLSLL